MATPARPDSSSDEFDALLQPLLPSAYGVAYRFTRNAADAEDLVQEAALLAFRGFGSFTPGTNFRAWFFRILTNAFLSRRRQTQRRGVPVDLDETPELYLYQRMGEGGFHSDVTDPATLLMNKLDSAAVEEALASLPEEYRVVAALYFMQDMPYQEIADTVGVPIGTVRSRLHRARRMMQKALWAVAEDRGIVGRLARSEAE